MKPKGRNGFGGQIVPCSKITVPFLFGPLDSPSLMVILRRTKASQKKHCMYVLLVLHITQIQTPLL